MKILINTIAKTKDYTTIASLFRIAEHYKTRFPEDLIEFLVSDRDKQLIQYIKSAVSVVVFKHPPSPLFKNLITDKKIHHEIREFQPDAILTIQPLKPIDNSVLIYLPPLSVARFCEEGSKLTKRIKDEIVAGMENSNKVVVFSNSAKKVLEGIFPAGNKGTKVLYPVFDRPLRTPDDAEKQAVKEKYAGGNEYFLCGNVGGEFVTAVLKGFSGFKKWQRSHMKLILLAKRDAEEQLAALLSSYRFKDDVFVLSEESPDALKCIASCYAVLMPDKYNTDFSLAVDAVQAEKPLMIPTGSVYSEVMKENAFYFSYQDRDDITRVLLESFREETKRSLIIKNASSMLRALPEANFCTNLRSLIKEGRT